jgi:hypothetical protein
MQIANPIYDTFFKYMISQSEMAKYIIEHLLEVQVITINPIQQEKVIHGIKELKIIRYDYSCTIKTKDGIEKLIIIELQKSENKLDIGRFRNYLAKNYKDSIVDMAGKDIYLPIVAIYFLGFDLENHQNAFIKVEGQLINLETKELIAENKDKFIDSLGHDLYIVQIPKINADKDSYLHRIFSMFDQNFFYNGGGKYKDVYNEGILEFPEQYIHAENKDIIYFLHHALDNETVMDDFQEGLRFAKLVEQEKQQEFIHGMMEGERSANINNAKKMKADGLAVDLIVKYTGLSIEQVISF